ncbi:MAG: ROK family protein [Clostridia bacterium]|nr:ROK family protein [Clostridia bacterium]MBR6512229.1 ROK family protein [Clostridia bacterium]
MYKIGIDLGGTNIAAGVVGFDNKIVMKASVPTDLPKTPDEIADSIAALVKDVAAKAFVRMDEVSVVGIGTPGAVNADGVVENDANLGFVNTPLRAMLEERLGVACRVGNDANCAALGEQIAGAGRGTRDFIAVTLGTGIGGGIVLGGKLLTGVNGAAGEIGHMVIDREGIPCKCGRIGCFEQYASATALVNAAKEVFPDVTCAKDVFDLAHSDNLRALEIIDDYIEYLSDGITNLINIFQPEMICIGGGVAAQGEYLLKPLRERVEEKRYTKNASVQTKICAAVLGNDAGIIGAVNL